MMKALRDWWRGYSDADIIDAARLVGQWSSGIDCEPGTVLHVPDSVMKAMSEPSVWSCRRDNHPPRIVTDGIVKVSDE